MGMDLVGVGNESLHQHYNWTGWSVLLGVLDQIGADTSEFSGSNDGEIVSEDAALACAELLHDALDREALVVVNIPDSSYSGGVYSRFDLAPDPAVPLPITLADLELLAAPADAAPVDPALAAFHEALSGVTGDTSIRTQEIFGIKSSLYVTGQKILTTNQDPSWVFLADLDDTDIAWLRSFALFCERSGGFAQY